MNNFRIIWDNSKFDAATLTPSSEATGLPASNLQNTLRKKVWRTTGITSESLTVDLGSEEIIQCVVLVNHNFTVDAQITIKASNVSDFSSLEYNVTVDIWQPVYGYGEGGYGEGGYGGYLTDSDRIELFISPIFIKWTGDVTARYWKIEFSDSGNTDGYFEIGRIFIAPFLEPVYNFAYGWHIQVYDPSIVTRSIGGQKWVDQKDWYHRLTLPLHVVDDSNKYADFIALCKRIGIKKDFILDLAPEATGTDEVYNTFYGRLTETPDLEGYYNHSKSQIVFEESL